MEKIDINDIKPGSLGNIKDLLIKANSNDTPSWRENLNNAINGGRDDGMDNAKAPIDSQSEESSNNSATKQKMSGKKKDSGAQKPPSSSRNDPKESMAGHISKPKDHTKEPIPVSQHSGASGLEDLWKIAKASKAKKDLKESQVWIDAGLYQKIGLLNLKTGKPVPTKHVVNAILQMFFDEHKGEITKVMKS